MELQIVYHSLLYDTYLVSYTFIYHKINSLGRLSEPIFSTTNKVGTTQRKLKIGALEISRGNLSIDRRILHSPDCREHYIIILEIRRWTFVLGRVCVILSVVHLSYDISYNICTLVVNCCIDEFTKNNWGGAILRIVNCVVIIILNCCLYQSAFHLNYFYRSV